MYCSISYVVNLKLLFGTVPVFFKAVLSACILIANGIFSISGTIKIIFKLQVILSNTTTAMKTYAT